MLTLRGMAERTALTQRCLQRKLADCALISAEVEALQREAGGMCDGAGARIVLRDLLDSGAEAGRVPGIG